MAIKNTRVVTNEFKPSDGFINLQVIIKGADGSETALKAPVWGLDRDNPLHAEILAHPEQAAAQLVVKGVTVNVKKSSEDYKGLFSS